MENLFNSILSMSVDGTWLIVAVMASRFLLYKSPKYFRKILWGLVGIRLLVPFSFESMLSLMPEEINNTSQAVSQAVSNTVTQQQTFSVKGFLPYVWAVGACILIVYGIISFIKLKYKIFDAVIFKDNIYLSEKAESPFVCGFIKPRIYIPYNLDDKTRECILQHENTHIKYADHILKIVGFAILCIHWFNPLVWVSYFLFCKDIELACDEAVIKKYDKDDCKEYAKALLDIGVNRVRFSACPIAFGEVSIKERIKSVMGYKKAGKLLISLSLGLCVAVVLCFMTEPEAKAKGRIEDVVVEETTTETVTEHKPVHKPEPEPVTTPVTETSTTQEASTEPYTEMVTEPAIQHYEESIEGTEEDLLDYPFNGINILEHEFDEPYTPTPIYGDVIYNNSVSNSSTTGPETEFDEPYIPPPINEGVTYNNFSSNSVIGPKPELPTLASFNWDPAVTQSPMQNNGGNTNRPHFEGNYWVYN